MPTLPSPDPDPGCLFCRIIARELPATVVAEGAEVLAFADIAPAAPTHVLVVSKAHYPDVAALAAQEPEVLAELTLLAAEVAAAAGTPSHRLLFNTGLDAGQTVGHVHGHVLAGASMPWPPGYHRDVISMHV